MRPWRRHFSAAVDEREAQLVAHRVVAPDLVDVNVVLIAEPARDINHAGRHVQMKRSPDFREMSPLCQRFQVIDRLARLDFDDAL